MKPVIDDEIYLDMEQNQEHGQADLEREHSGDSFATTHSQPRISPDYPLDDDMDVFEGYSFNERHPTVIAEKEEVLGKEEPEETGQDGEFDPGKVPGSKDFTERMIHLTEALQSPTPRIVRRLPKPPPTHTSADMTHLPLPNATLLAIPDIPTQEPASPPTPPTDVVANAAAAAFASHHHQSFKPKPLRKRANFIRSRQEKIVVPVSEPELPDHRLADDRNEEVVNDSYFCKEEFDKCLRNFVNVDGGNHNGPRSIKTVSYQLFLALRTPDQTNEKRQLYQLSKYSLSTTRSLASLKTIGSKKKANILR